ncbi:MAG: peptidoglycan-binding protein [Acidimicrobiia bacterium]
MPKILRTAATACMAVSLVVMLSTAAGAAEPDLSVSWVENSPVIRLGDHGPAVAEWQALLNEWIAVAEPENAFRLATDGDFGSLTDGLTRSLQNEQGVPVDGIVGPLTRAAYLSAPALASADPDPAAGGPVVATGDMGPTVAAWQAGLNGWLRAEGSDETPLLVDGIFGARTDAITRLFQEDQRITVDGLVGPETLAAMISAPVIANPPAPAPAESMAPAAGVCADAIGPTATFVVRENAPAPRCLRVEATQRLELVNAAFTPITVDIGVVSTVVPMGGSVTVAPEFGTLLEPGVHTVHVSTFAGAGPQVWLVD